MSDTINRLPQSSRTNPITIAVAPNRGRRSKADHPALPITPDELADAASAASTPEGR